MATQVCVHCLQSSNAYYYIYVRVWSLHQVLNILQNAIQLLTISDQPNRSNKTWFNTTFHWPLFECIKSTFKRIFWISRMLKLCVVMANKQHMQSKSSIHYCLDTLVAMISKTIRQMLQTYGTISYRFVSFFVVAFGPLQVFATA